MKVKVKTHGAYRVFKPKKARRKEGKLKRPPPPPPTTTVFTGITGVTTRRLTGGKISSPSQPYNFPAQFNFNPNQTYLNKLIKVFRINRKLQAAEFISRYELNSAGMWTSRARAETSDIQNLKCVKNVKHLHLHIQTPARLTARVITLIQSF